MLKKYDVVVIGAGPAGIFTCYELHKENKDLKVLLIDKGHNINDRQCPILQKKIEKCPERTVGNETIVGCNPACSITAGFGGAGAYSDGKFNVTSEFGGWMMDYLPNEKVEELIEYVDSINLEHGATTSITDPTTNQVKEIEKKGWAVGLKLLRAKVRHLGTEQNLEILKDINKYLSDKIDYSFKTKVEDIMVSDNKINGVILSDGTKIEADYVVMAPGRDGSKWMSKVLSNHGVEMFNNQVDIGVRVETSDIIMEEINENLYEGKFIFHTSVGTTVRTFCSNPSGHVVIENHSGTMLANGHAYKDPKLGSRNTNFALLVSHVFDHPFNQPNEFATQVSDLANKLSNGSIIVQKYGDILRGRRTTEKRLKEGYIIPTLKEAVPGDLGLVLPYNTMKSLIEMMHALDHVTPGIANEHTLFYGVEAKFYSSRPQVNEFFEGKINNLYFAGDGAGLTRGLAQAGANGVWVARSIIKKIKGDK
ncbi:putative FAD-dependent dehydrogenase [Bacilli bacterium PM5-3]|nr:putative FAD-dependent dehydrogenase [Bacilli bacterium PM5-3]MDH6603275.1 putative FAD-dependent dehydrogenase [Bacilli bacterium PM5-9]